MPLTLPHSNPVLLFTALFTLRLLNALTLRTFFQPDEYFQALEPAWALAFSSTSAINSTILNSSSLTGAWITWEWRAGLRSSLHPYIFAAAYRLAVSLCAFLDLSEGTRVEVLIAAPRVLQTGIAAAGDWFTYRLAGRVYGGGVEAVVALGLAVMSPWNWFCATRTLSNSLETVLTVAGLGYWPWGWHAAASSKETNKSGAGAEEKGLYTALTLAAFACLLRPTNVILWATLAAALLLQYPGHARLQKLAMGAVGCGSAVLTVSVSADRAFYGKWTFPPLQFLYFNLYQSLATFYGRNRADYYFTEGLPLLLTTYLPFAGVGVWNALRQGKGSSSALAMTVVVMTGTLSLISHKEVRFLYPLLPILHVLGAGPFAAFFFRSTTSATYKTSITFSPRKLKCFLLALLLVLNLAFTAYISLVHQRGVLDVLSFVRHIHEARLLTTANNSSVKTTVAFLMPCHSTPWRSHLVHEQIEAWALSCEPPLDVPVGERGGYFDQADEFYARPRGWVEGNMGGKGREGEDMVVMFEALLKGEGAGNEGIRGWLEEKEYAECWRAFNSHWHDDGRRRGDVVVWCKGGSSG